MELAPTFRPLSEEINDKLESMVSLPDEVERELRDAVRERLGAEALARLDRSLAYVGGLRAVDGGHGSLRAYMSHPLRVALSVLRLQVSPRIESVEIAALHNVMEICGVTASDLAAQGYAAATIDAIERLTIDRALENDEAYLDGFYSKIEAWGPELALVRVADKLDNLLGTEMTDCGPTIRHYVELARVFVLPMAARLDPRLGDLFAAACERMAVARCAEAYKARYDRFLAANTSP